MIGPEGAAQVVATVIDDLYVAKLDELIDRLGLDAGDTPGLGDLPYANMTVHTEPRPLGTFTVNEYPVNLVIAQEGAIVEELDRVAGGIVYLVRYPVRWFLFARGGNFIETDLRRKRYVLAARELVLQSAEAIRAHPTSVRESYSDVSEVPDKEVRTVGAAYVEFTIDVEETLAPLDYQGIGAPSIDAPEPNGWELVPTFDLSHPEAD